MSVRVVRCPYADGAMTTTTQAAIRLAILDSDSGFLQVLTKRLGAAGWQHRVLASPVPLDTLVAMRLNAVVIDLAVLGPQAWNYLEKLCTRLPQLGVVVCTGQSSVAQRVRGLRMGADDWVTKPCHPEELIARVEAVVRRRKRAEARTGRGAGGGRRDRDPGRPVPGLRRRPVGRPHAARVRAHPAARRGRGPGAAARGDLRARLGLRDGPRRPLGRRLRAQAAPEARAGLAGLALHPHALRHRLPVRSRAGGGGGSGRGARGRRAGRGEPRPRRRSSRPPEPSQPLSWVPWGRRPASTCATSRSSSCSRSPSGSCRAAARPA